MGAGGEDCRKFLKSRLLNLREVPLLISRGHSKKATFVILLCFLILPNFFSMFLLDMFRVKSAFIVHLAVYASYTVQLTPW